MTHIHKRLWELSAFITKGATPTTYGFRWESSGVRFLRSECVSGHGLDLTQSMFVSEEANRMMSRSEVSDGDLLMTITGNVGRVVRVDGLARANINQHIARIRVTNPAADSGYIYHYLSQAKIRAHFERITTGQAYPQISLVQVRDTEIPLPPIETQRRVAKALTDVDRVILSIERLIAKKYALRQGIMQQLLTGKTRLPGFDAPWRETTLGEISRIKTGKRNNQDKRDGGRYPFYVRSANVERIDSYTYDCEAILIPGEGNIGSIFHYIAGKFEVHQRVYKISDFNDETVGKFVFYFIRQFFGAHAMGNSVKATVDSLRLPTFKSFGIVIPNRREEQEAIVAVLDDVDAEMTALEARLKSVHAIKQGMMQVLLAVRSRSTPVEAMA